MIFNQTNNSQTQQVLIKNSTSIKPISLSKLEPSDLVGLATAARISPKTKNLMIYLVNHPELAQARKKNFLIQIKIMESPSRRKVCKSIKKKKQK